ncbi:MAG: ABC transporter ATP-binding protein [Rhodospirillales bacterium]|nr:ABC transporter ATP-binding protein [Rhodospirillales bacterium]
MSQNSLHLNNVSHAFGSHTVLSGVSVFVAPGETVCLLGPSGCGKTTLLRIAAGLETLQSGQVTIGQRLVGQGRGGIGLPPEERGVGFVFQDYALFPHLTIRDNVAFGLRDGKAGRGRWVEAALARLGLAGQADKYPHALSGGQQQRVALLRALAPEPGVMLLDEPFSNLDATLRVQVRADTLGLLKETGVATLMVTHDPEEAMFMADRLLVMNDGRIIQAGTPLDIYFRPASSFVAALFGPLNRIDAVVRGGRADTFLGPFAAAGLADGTPVEIQIRPEALAPLGPFANGPAAPDPAVPPRAPLTVLDVHPIGRASFVRFAGPGGQRLDARVAGVFRAAPGTVVDVAVDPARSFVFPR